MYRRTLLALENTFKGIIKQVATSKVHTIHGTKYRHTYSFDDVRKPFILNFQRNEAAEFKIGQRIQFSYKLDQYKTKDGRKAEALVIDPKSLVLLSSDSATSTSKSSTTKSSKEESECFDESDEPEAHIKNNAPASPSSRSRKQSKPLNRHMVRAQGVQAMVNLLSIHLQHSNGTHSPNAAILPSREQYLSFDELVELVLAGASKYEAFVLKSPSAPPSSTANEHKESASP